MSDMSNRFQRNGGALVFFLLIGAGLALLPSSAFAIPAWSRKYDVPCSMCHYPTPPRLNIVGHEFRRAQFRMPEDFDKTPSGSRCRTTCP